MKLYKIRGQTTEDTLTQWAGTQADAAKARKDFKNRGLSHVKTEDVDIPTDKAGLLAWLNANAVGE